MRRILLSALLAAFAISGCQKVEPESSTFANTKEAVTFSATIETMEDDSAVETKTSMDNEGNVLWKGGDEVSIFAGSTINEHYRVTDASDGKTTAALNRVESTGYIAGGEIDNNVAFYPYASTATIAKKSGAYVISNIALPATQNYAQASFANGAFPMAAVTSSVSDYNLKFKNIIGGLKLQLKGTAAIASVSITGNNNEALCGDATVNISNTALPVISMTGASSTITLNCGGGVQLNATTATAFIIALPPMTMTGGFTVTVTDTDGASMEIKTTKTQTITRSNILSMPAVTYVGTLPEPDPQPAVEYVDLGLSSGLKWATCNLCENGFVSSPEAYGDYYAWGETQPYYTEGHSQDSPCSNWQSGKTGYNWASYSWCQGSNTTLTKYNNTSANGTVDNKTEFSDYSYADDPAQILGKWRTPSYTEWAELVDNCTWTWTSQNGVDGMLVTGPNGKSIFLPGAGTRLNQNTSDVGSYGNYWASTLHTDNSTMAKCVNFNGTGTLRYYRGYRYYGRAIRPVYDASIIPVVSVRLNKSSLSINVGSPQTLTATTSPANPTNKAVDWTSSNSSVATVSSDGTITPVAVGTATITVTTRNGGKTATCTVTVNPATDGSNGHAYVDLGLPSGVKWATCNLGATAPEGYGDYYAYGETSTYYSSQSPLTWKSGKSAGYAWTSYQWCTAVNAYDYNMTKYNTSDKKAVLDLADDAARANWHGTWRVPTAAEWQELLDNCTWTRTTQNGVVGRLVKSKINNKSIFLPAAGTMYLTELNDTGTGGYYMSSSVDTDTPIYAKYMYFDYINQKEYLFFSKGTRNNGRSVRPVFK